MKQISAAILAFGMFGSTAVLAKETARTFECTFEPAVGTSLREGKFVQKPVNFRDMTTPWSYRFTLGTARPGNAPIDVSVESAKDFATISGSYKAFAVAPESYVISIFKMGNCMFSSQICGASIQLTNLDSEKAAAAITPVSYFGDQRDAEFFHVVLLGRCQKLDIAGSVK